MQKLVIEGGVPLEGEITLHGAKNSTLPILAGALLCDGRTVLENCPRLTDVFAACRILTHLGCRCRIAEHTVTLQMQNLRTDTIPEALMQEMRSSIIFLGAVLGRTGSCHVSYPGGCELGPRPIDMHLEALRQMGARFLIHDGQLDCSAPEGLHGAVIHLPFPSVGATENIMLAAVLAKGRTVLHNAAKEPEICDLAAFLRSCGADISGDGAGTMVISGVKQLRGCSYSIMPDRIAGITYLGAAAITGGTVCLRGTDASPMDNMLPVLEQMGCRIYPEPDRLHLLAPRRLRPVASIRTMPHPGFPTDAQAIFMAILSLADGVSVLEENIFACRYRHVDALVKMGAKIHVSGRTAVVTGVRSLSGACVTATDLRGGAAMVLAGLAASGTTEVRRICYIDRGYEAIEQVLRGVGGRIVRMETGGSGEL
ncbi:UDP-N-acetylglucosamine 1-carboxyvinyltransferase [uncultured Ruminococcus sp.]|uniref:UDP-N-acetylglucosamine 1-carboxyvinyltransferase n=1 Tax=uncultured Ruminococcus sp. TaxID=165186 RepID=UPI0025FEFBFA|nr:UDP-N-acetylglucosamine 1-carboxyvinyltransferase [uncultured Ruminococcus sp.]